MISISDFLTKEKLYESNNSYVYRGIHEANNEPVVIKILKGEYPSPERITQFRREYELLKHLDVEGIIKVIGFENYQNSYAIIFEDFGAESVKNILEKRKLEVKGLIEFFIRCSDVLGQIHKAKIIHMNINPSNIVWNPKTNQIKIIDFGISTILPHQVAITHNPNILEGTLAYISPEQTGRMNRVIDYRTDLYSLGVTFYEMLTGQLPFQSNDAMEMVHCHIAKNPIPPHQIENSALDGGPEGVEVLSKIIEKLMSKTAEERYQSAFGLKSDLESCLNQLNSTGKLKEFKIGQMDTSDNFQIPQKLYGREKEINSLVSSFDRVSNPLYEMQGCEMIMVSGHAGIGKSALVSEVHKSIAIKRGYFISGKFDQFKRDIPYSALIQAYQQLVNHILSESKERVDSWKEKILDAVGSTGQVLIDVIPEVELIIGKQPPVAKREAEREKNRFNLVFRNFTKLFTSKDHPLTIFLDDLQWADLPSLMLIKLFMTDPQSNYLLIIGAYRSNEVDSSHGLSMTLDELQKSDLRINTIQLDPLDEQNIRRLLADTLKIKTEQTKELSKICFDKTNGNPFFLIQFLQTLHEASLFEFDTGQMQWSYDTEKIRKMQITDNVVDLMVDKIRRFPNSTQSVLKLAACIGNQFNLGMLSLLNKETLVETANLLLPTLKSGLIIPLDEGYKYIGMSDKDLADSQILKNLSYCFSHDRIQQAAYSMIDEKQKNELHLKIGRLLISNQSLENHQEILFDIVDHYNSAIDLIKSQKEIDELISLNLAAGKKAKTSVAYEPALNYLQTGSQLLGEDKWNTKYEKTLEIYNETIETAFLNDNNELMIQTFETILDKAKTVFDKSKAYEVRISAFSKKREYKEVIHTGLQVLNSLGIKTPSDAGKLHILLHLIKIKLLLVGKNDDRLINLPETSHKNYILAARIVKAMNPALYFTNVKLGTLLLFKLTSLTIKYGSMALSSVFYISYGLVNCGILGNIKSGYRFGKLALALHGKYESEEQKAWVYVGYTVLIHHWKNHIRSGLQILEKAYKSGLETGDYESVGYCFSSHVILSYLSGRKLDVIYQEAEKLYDIAYQLHQEHTYHIIKLFLQLFSNLMEESEDPLILTGKQCDEENIRPLLFETSPRSVCNFYYAKMELSYLFDNNQAAVEFATNIEKYQESLTSSAQIPFVRYYDSLCRLSIYKDSARSKQNHILRRVKKNQKMMKKWAYHAPMNYKHLWYLVEAEKNRVLEKNQKATAFYDKAIAGAKENEYLQIEGLANELAAKYYLFKGKETIASGYMKEARYCYLKWGAIVKVKQLDEKYPELLLSYNEYERPEDQTTVTMTTRSITTTTDRLDLATIQKASQAISEEIHLGRLLEKLLKIVIANAGAQKGFIILNDKEGLFVEGEASADQDEVTVLQHIPISVNDNFAVVIINYVLRTKETLVLDDAVNKGSFTSNEYIIKNLSKSIFCMPLIYQNKLSGILYLENNLATGTFTSERVEIMQMLTGQIVISVENARLYENLEEYSKTLEKKVKERTGQIEQQKKELQITLENLQETQSQLIESEKMAALGSLVAGVAHEINTPVGISVTAASNLADETKQIADLYQKDQINRSDFKNYLQSADQTAKLILANMDRTASMIQSFKQISADQSTEEKRRFNLREYFEDVIRSLYPKLKDKHVHIELSVVEKIEIDSYPGPFSQIITNLVLNSLEHGRDEGRKSKLKITMLARIDEKNLIIEYRDDGKGIPEKILPKIFDPFFTTNKKIGTGLGLNIVYNLVTQKLNGEIKCESKEGKGVVFLLQMPIGKI